jgi:hypothetical protein
VEKLEVGISYREKTADFVGCEQDHFLLFLEEDVGKRQFSSKVRAATNVAAIDFITYNFTKITITTPPLTRILDRLIGRSISLCGNSV